MAELEIVLGVLASASALYGFTIAYYIFARGLQDQEQARLWQTQREWHKPETEKELDPGLRKIAWRRVALNIFLMGSTILFMVSTWGALAYLGTPSRENFRLSVNGFLALALAVVTWFLVAGALNLRDTFVDMPGRRIPEWLFRAWNSSQRPPVVSLNILWPLLIGIVLLVVSVITLQQRTDYLVQHSYSEEASVISSLTFAPIWEESVKVGLGLLGGALSACLPVLVTWIRAKRSGRPRPDTRLLWRWFWPWASIGVFLLMGVRAAVVEGLGGLNVLKLVGHPGFSILAVLVALEAKPRTVWFIGLGFGSHSMMNFIVNIVPEGPARIALYMIALFLVVCIDLFFLARWYPSIRSILGRFLPRTTREG